MLNEHLHDWIQWGLLIFQCAGLLTFLRLFNGLVGNKLLPQTVPGIMFLPDIVPVDQRSYFMKSEFHKLLGGFQIQQLPDGGYKQNGKQKTSLP